MAEQTVEQQLAELEAKEKLVQEKKASIESEEQNLKTREEKINALKLEEQRIIDSVTKLKNERREEKESFGERLRNENLEKAKERIISEFGYKDPDAIKVLVATYEKFDSGDVGEDKIYSNLLKAHVSLNPGKYIDLEKKQAAAARAAEEQAARASGSALKGSDNIPMEQVELDEVDIEAARKIGMDYQTYKGLKARGKLE